MAATPHVGLRYPVVPSELPARVAALRGAIAGAGIPLDVRVGGELAPAVAADLSEEDLLAIALGGGSCVLLECPFVPSGGLMPALVAHLHRGGFRVLLAHPERSPEFLRDPARLMALVDAGAYVQVTAGSLRGDFGRTVRRYALALLDEGLAHVAASDAHDAAARSPELVGVVGDAVRRARLAPATTSFLTEEAPRALLEDAPLSAPPLRRGRRPWRRR
jgi:protein-tyrosine phosphatase